MSLPSLSSTGNSLNSEMTRVHVWISGRVQGVGYRFSTLHQAKQRDLHGWVKNLPDGRVEAVFEGTLTNIEEMIQWCHHGPEAALPKNVEVEYEEVEELQGFEIVR
ncbi:MAG: acylphosphatase [Microcoleaceae cyanobacterium]